VETPQPPSNAREKPVRRARRGRLFRILLMSCTTVFYSRSCGRRGAGILGIPGGALRCSGKVSPYITPRSEYINTPGLRPHPRSIEVVQPHESAPVAARQFPHQRGETDARTLQVAGVVEHHREADAVDAD